MKLKTFLSAFAITIAISGFATPPNEPGKTIFATRCGSCHNINKSIVGPALAGIEQRRSMDWIIKFVQSSQSMIKGGDKDAGAMFAKYKIVMPDHADLQAADIKNIVDYIKSQAVSTDASDKAPFARPGKLAATWLPLSLSNYGFFIGFLIAIIVLIGALLAFVQTKEYERNKALQK